MTILRRLFFRFAFIYFVLFAFPFPLPPFAWWQTTRQWLGDIVAARVFHLSGLTTSPTSTDTLWDWIFLATTLVIAAAGAIVWMLIDRRERPRLREGLRVYVRFFLAVVIIGYGAAKVIPSQFPSPTLDKLVHTYGGSSPMGLLWTFMGASAAYSIFTGAMEILGGVLVAFRRTMLPGALMCAAVMSNVVALNFFYDVPVKIFSTHLLVMSLWLAWPERRRLAVFFADPPTGEPLLRAPRWRVAGVVAGALFIAFSTVTALQQSLQIRKFYGDDAARSPIRGIWRVDELIEAGRTRPPLITDSMRWRRLVFDNANFSAILFMNDERHRFKTTAAGSKITLVNRDDAKDRIDLTYARPRPDTLVLDGTSAGKPFHAVCRLEPEQNFVLHSRGFHWINEFSFNR